MVSKTKKYIWRGFKIFWIIIGILILLWTGFWFTQIPSTGELGGAIAGTVLFAAGIYALFVYIILTILIFLIKFIIKVIRKIKEKSRKKSNSKPLKI